MVISYCQFAVDVGFELWDSLIEVNMVNKTDRIIDLTRNKTKKTSIMINEELWELFKKACQNNNITPTLKIEKWMVNFVDENDLLL